MELTGYVQSDSCPEGAVVRQRGVAQVAPFISGCHPCDAQSPILQHGQALPVRRGPRRSATSNDFQSVFHPCRQVRRHITCGVTRKYSDGARCYFQQSFGGTFSRNCRCGQTRVGKSKAREAGFSFTCVTWMCAR